MIDLRKIKFLSLKVTIIPILMMLSASFATNASAQIDTPAAQEAACNAGNGAACTALGLRLRDGVGIAKDEKRGADLFLKACQGQTRDAQGCMLWGYAMQTGQGAYVNLAQAAAFYETACNMNNAIGCNNHGLLLRDGNGVVKNEVLASSALFKSCQLLFAEGCQNEGNLYRAPTVIAVNPSLALRAYEKGCGMGNLPSCHNQAWYLEGGKGISQDRSKAVQLYTTACLAGFELSCQSAQNLTGTRPGQSAQNAATAGMSYMSCHGFIRANRKIFIAPVIIAASARDTEMARAYAQKLRNDGLAGLTANDPPGSPLPEMSAFCIVEPTRAGAERKRQALIRGSGIGPVRERMNVVLTPFDPV